ncbi:MAG: GNAT family N-acetyltransferase [archaeon]
MIKIRKYQARDAKQVVRVIHNTFEKFNYGEHDKKAAQDYLNYFNPNQDQENLEEILSNCPIMFVLQDSSSVVGVVRGRYNRIVNLFLLEKYHKKGLGKKLVQRFESEVREKGSKHIKIRASLYATPFYQAMGYKRTTGTRKMRKVGVLFNPMIKQLK